MESFSLENRIFHMEQEIMQIYIYTEEVLCAIFMESSNFIVKKYFAAEQFMLRYVLYKHSE